MISATAAHEDDMEVQRTLLVQGALQIIAIYVMRGCTKMMMRKRAACLVRLAVLASLKEIRRGIALVHVHPTWETLA